MKRFLLFFFLVLVAKPIFAADFTYEYKGQTLKYSIISDSDLTCKVSVNSGLEGELIIPDIVSFSGNDYTVTSIDRDAFEYCRGLTSVEIPNSVTEIGVGAFYYCEGLTSVVFGNSLTSIGSVAFSHCISLESVEIPNSVTYLGDACFQESGLVSIVIPDQITKIGSTTFNHCYRLRSVVLGESVKSIGTIAFAHCSGLRDIQFNENLTLIGRDAFEFCTHLTDLKLPSKLSSINEQAFVGCFDLKTIWLPNSLDYIGNRAFSECSNIKDIYYDTKIPTDNAKANIFDSVIYSNATLWVPEEALELCMIITPWRKFSNINSFDFSNGLNDIILFGESEDQQVGKCLMQVYTLSGVKIADTLIGLRPGIYIILQGKCTKRIVVK